MPSSASGEPGCTRLRGLVRDDLDDALGRRPHLGAADSSSSAGSVSPSFESCALASASRRRGAERKASSVSAILSLASSTAAGSAAGRPGRVEVGAQARRLALQPEQLDLDMMTCFTSGASARSLSGGTAAPRRAARRASPLDQLWLRCASCSRKMPFLLARDPAGGASYTASSFWAAGGFLAQVLRLCRRCAALPPRARTLARSARSLERPSRNSEASASSRCGTALRPSPPPAPRAPDLADDAAFEVLDVLSLAEVINLAIAARHPRDHRKGRPQHGRREAGAMANSSQCTSRRRPDRPRLSSRGATRAAGMPSRLAARHQRAAATRPGEGLQHRVLRPIGHHLAVVDDRSLSTSASRDSRCVITTQRAVLELAGEARLEALLGGSGPHGVVGSRACSRRVGDQRARQRRPPGLPAGKRFAALAPAGRSPAECAEVLVEPESCAARSSAASSAPPRRSARLSRTVPENRPVLRHVADVSL